MAPLVLAQHVYPDMRAAGRGWIVHVGSIAGEVGIGRVPRVQLLRDLIEQRRRGAHRAARNRSRNLANK